MSDSHVAFSSGLDLQYDGTQIRGNTLIIKGIIAKGVVETNAGKVSLLYALVVLRIK